MRQDSKRHAGRADRGAVDVRQAVFHHKVVGEIPGLEVVKSVDENVRALRETLDVRVIDVVDDRGALQL